MDVQFTNLRFQDGAYVCLCQSSIILHYHVKLNLLRKQKKELNANIYRK